MKKFISGNFKGTLTPIRIWAFGFLMLFVLNIFWESANNLPPSWDMAHHQLMGLQFLETFSSGNLLEGYTGLTNYYPPLYYLNEVLVLLLFGDTQFLPLLSNLFGLFLLSFFTFRTAEKIMPSPAAVSAGLVVLMLPMVAWTSRVSLLDTGLAGWVILAFYLVIRSNCFEHRGYTFLFGLTCAAGTLHKWTFPFFLVFTVFYILAVSGSRKKVLLNLCL
ncbi:MAG: glycosyltransferase family 39 protein, partial [Acidobacteriota bacterium]